MANDYSDADVKFIQDMIPHHQAAVDMTVQAYAKLEDPDVVEWARAIWDGQEAEIERFRAWLKDRGIPEKRGKGMGH